MKYLLLTIGLLFAVLAPRNARAEAIITVEKPWARASVGTMRPGVTYMTLRNSGDQPVTLKGVSTEIAKMAMIHKSTVDASGNSTMGPAGPIVVAPGKAVTFEPGGLHIMLMKLNKPLVEGDKFPLSLVFSDGGQLTVQVPILAMSARGPAE